MTRGSRGTLYDEDGLLLYAMAPGDPVFWNGVVRTGAEPDADTLVERGRRFFGAMGRGFSVLALEPRDHDLVAAFAARGRVPVSSEPQMVHRTPPRTVELPRGVEIATVDSADLAARCLDVLIESFAGHGLDADAVHAVYPDLASLAGDGVVTQLALVGKRAAACGMAYLSHRVALLAHVGTRPEYRRRGVASLLTTSLCAAAVARGADTATLQASPDARRLYGRLGFESAGTLHVFLADAPGPD